MSKANRRAEPWPTIDTARRG